jgi:2-iminobutanoate/2-iminopropanoate deaminase
MTRSETVHTDRAPRAIGPYSQAIVVDGWVYCSGQIALDPATGEVVAGDVTRADRARAPQPHRGARGVGRSARPVVKTTVFLANMADFAAMNEVYGRHFGSHRPGARDRGRGGLPRGVAVEIECVARVG